MWQESWGLYKATDLGSHITFYSAVQCLVCETRVPLSRLWLRGIWSALSYAHGPGRQRSHYDCEVCLQPTQSIPHPAYLFDFFCVTWMWLSPLVVLDRSLKHQEGSF